jgi:cAMP-binding proteins - catabolite gene activator and regulatory subunit of cAMP-dependent protein kinases
MDDLDELARTALFAGTTRADLESLAPALRRRGVAAGGYLWHTGDPASAAIVVLAGLIKVRSLSADGHELVSHLRVPGDTLGEYHLFDDGGLRRYDAVAVERSECLVIGRDTLLYFLERNPPLLRRVAANMLRSLLDLLEIAEMHTLGQTEDRLTKSLLKLAERHGEPTTDGTRIPIKLSQSLLAGLAGGTRENVNRALGRLSAAGVISRDQGVITIRQDTVHKPDR